MKALSFYFIRSPVHHVVPYISVCSLIANFGVRITVTIKSGLKTARHTNYGTFKHCTELRDWEMKQWPYCPDRVSRSQCRYQARCVMLHHLKHVHLLLRTYNVSSNVCHHSSVLLQDFVNTEYKSLFFYYWHFFDLSFWRNPLPKTIQTLATTHINRIAIRLTVPVTSQINISLQNEAKSFFILLAHWWKL